MGKNYLGSDVLTRFDVTVDGKLFRPVGAHVYVFAPDNTKVAVGPAHCLEGEVNYILPSEKIEMVGIYTLIFKVDLGKALGEREHIVKVPVVMPPIKKSLVKELVK
jgi:hypothetical protein